MQMNKKWQVPRKQALGKEVKWTNSMQETCGQLRKKTKCTCIGCILCMWHERITKSIIIKNTCNYTININLMVIWKFINFFVGLEELVL
jgi:hypothetical protein